MKTITLKSYDKTVIFCYSLYLKNLLDKQNIPYTYLTGKQLSGKVTLLKSPHVYKKFKEHYKQNVYTLSFSIKVDSIRLQKIVSVLNGKDNNLTLILS